MEMFKNFVGREKKGQAAFPPIVLSRGGGRAKLESKDFTNRCRLSKFVCEGLNWKVHDP